MKKGDIVIFSYRDQPMHSLVIGQVTRVGKRVVFIRTRGGDEADVRLDDIGDHLVLENTSLADPRIDEIVSAYFRLAGEYERERLAWAEARQRAIVRFLQDWDKENPHPVFAGLKTFVREPGGSKTC